MDALEKSGKNELALVGDKLSNRVVTGMRYDEEVGYSEGYELTDMDGKVYPITPNERRMIIEEMNDPSAKVIELGDTTLAIHQVKHIKKYKNYFGPRPGGY